MPKANKTLFIFEGTKTENAIFECLLFTLRKKEIADIKLFYEANIYDFYQNIKNEEYIDVIEVLRERNGNTKNSNILLNLSKDDFTYIYIFFDYDGHDPAASNNKVLEMINYFDNETQNGKLFISYPMVEAFKNFDESGKFCGIDCQIEIKGGKKYKEHIGSKSKFNDIKAIKQTSWEKILKNQLLKASCITDGFVEMNNKLNKFPTYEEFKKINQEIIFKSQNEKYLKRGKVAVLSSIFQFYFEHFGETEYNRIINS